MLDTQKIQRRQSEIRSELAELAKRENLTDEETRSMDSLGDEYQRNESRYRAAQIAEDDERRQAGKELETRESRDWTGLIDKFEVRQAVLHLDEGRILDGATAEVVQELRAAGGYRGVPIPFEALETRAGETIAGSIPDPIKTQPIIDRLFPQSVAGAMGARLISIPAGQAEYPVTSSSVSASWSSSETGNVGGPTQYTTADQVLKPNQNLGIQMKITRRAMKQAAGIEEAVRRDMRGAIGAAMDKVVFQGSGTSGEPLGVITGAATYGINSTAIAAAATWSAFRAAIVSFLTANAAGGPGAARVLIRPEVWEKLDSTYVGTTAVTEFDRLAGQIGSVVMTANGLAAPTGTPTASKCLLTVSPGGVNPIFVGVWGAVDVIRDPYSDAQSGGLRLTGIVTMDVTISRAVQLEVLTGVQD